MTDVTSGEQAQTFAERTRLAASEELTALSARRTSIEGQIEGLRIELESVSRQTHEAQVVLDALDGKLVHTDDATRHEPPARADWGGDRIDPEYLECARSFAASREGSFTVTDLGADLREAFPGVRIHGEAVDAILSTLLSADDIRVDSSAVGEMPRYVAAADDPGVTRTSPPTEELESARSEEGGVQPKSDEESGDSQEGEPPADVLPAASGVDTRKVVDDAVLEHLAEHARSRREDIMSALTLSEIAAAQSLSRLVRKGEIKVVTEQPTRWSLADAEPPKPETPPKPEPDTSASTNGAAATDGRESRRGQAYITLEVVRDAAKNIAEKFNSKTLAAWMTEHLDIGDVNPQSLGRYIRTLAEKGVLERSGGASGPHVKYEYVKPNGSGPTHRPRSDHPRQAPKGAKVEAGRGEAVPHTGRAKGRSGKSGENKKNQSLGFRVKTSRGDRKRAG